MHNYLIACHDCVNKNRNFILSYRNTQIQYTPHMSLSNSHKSLTQKGKINKQKKKKKISPRYTKNSKTF